MVPAPIGCQVGRCLAAKTGRARATQREVRTGVSQRQRDLFVSGYHRQHHCAEPIFGGDVQIGAVFDQEKDGGQMATVGGQHHTSLSMPIARVGIGAAGQKAAHDLGISTPHCIFPGGIHGANRIYKTGSQGRTKALSGTG